MNILKTKKATSRKLDGLEQAFWLLNQNRSTHFCIVAEIEGGPTVEVWEEAATYLAGRLPYASARILPDHDGPRFEFDQAPQIPLTVLVASRNKWPEFVEEELARHIDADRDRLIRITLVQDGAASILILTLHHSVGDGPSAVHLIRDLLSTASGQAVEVEQDVQSLEQKLDDLERPEVSFPPARDDLQTAPSFRTPTILRPEVSAGVIAAGDLEGLREACRKQGTTIHGAVCAASARAFTSLSPQRSVLPPRVFSPVDARRRLFDGTENLGAYINAITVDLVQFSDDFWEDARLYSGKVGLFNNPDVLAFGIRQVRDALSGNPTVEETAAVWAHVYGAELLVSNLGVLGLPSRYGDITLKAIWGPAVSTGIEREQTLGIATFGGDLRILHTSFEPVRGLVQAMLGILYKEVSAVA